MAATGKNGGSAALIDMLALLITAVIFLLLGILLEYLFTWSKPIDRFLSHVIDSWPDDFTDD